MLFRDTIPETACFIGRLNGVCWGIIAQHHPKRKGIRYIQCLASSIFVPYFVPYLHFSCAIVSVNGEVKRTDDRQAILIVNIQYTCQCETVNQIFC